MQSDVSHINASHNPKITAIAKSTNFSQNLDIIPQGPEAQGLQLGSLMPASFLLHPISIFSVLITHLQCSLKTLTDGNSPLGFRV